MARLNEGETKAIKVICDDCDELDGWGFTRLTEMMVELVKCFKNGNVAGGYVTALMNKGLIDVTAEENEVWVRPEVFEVYC